MTKVFTAAVALLARREHGALELAEKLIKKNYADDEVQAAIKTCQDLDLQSDQRYVEMMLRVRVQQGYGPERIRRELQLKKIDRELYEHVLEMNAVDWLVCAKQVLHKKYKSNHSQSWLIQQKQKQFLLYRGFTMHTIAQVFSGHHSDDVNCEDGEYTDPNNEIA